METYLKVGIGDKGKQPNVKVSSKEAGQRFEMCISFSGHKLLYTDRNKGRHTIARLRFDSTKINLDSIVVYDPWRRQPETHGIHQKLWFFQDEEQRVKTNELLCFSGKDTTIYAVNFEERDCNGTGCWNEYTLFFFCMRNNVHYFALCLTPYYRMNEWAETITRARAGTKLQTFYYVSSQAWNDLPHKGYFLFCTIDYNGVNIRNTAMYVEDHTTDVEAAFFSFKFIYNYAKLSSVYRALGG